MPTFEKKLMQPCRSASAEPVLREFADQPGPRRASPLVARPSRSSRDRSARGAGRGRIRRGSRATPGSRRRRWRVRCRGPTSAPSTDVMHADIWDFRVSGMLSRSSRSAPMISTEALAPAASAVSVIEHAGPRPEPTRRRRRGSRGIVMRRGGPRAARRRCSEADRRVVPRALGPVGHHAADRDDRERDQGEVVQVPALARRVVDLRSRPAEVDRHRESVGDGDHVDEQAPAAEREELLAVLVDSGPARGSPLMRWISSGTVTIRYAM